MNTIEIVITDADKARLVDLGGLLFARDQIGFPLSMSQVESAAYCAFVAGLRSELERLRDKTVLLPRADSTGGAQ